MPSRRLIAALIAVGLSVGPLAVAGRAASSSFCHTKAYRCVTAYIAVHDGPAGRHRTILDTRLYLPASATPAHPAPAVLMTNGFGLSKDAAEITSTADFFARHGYVVLTYTGQGWANSSGCIQLDSVSYDVKDASGLITAVLARGRYAREVARDRIGPIVGMIGGSYGGGITLTVAEHDQRVRAIVPGRTWNSLQYSLYPNNWIVPGSANQTGFDHQLTSLGVFKAEWTSLFYADGNAWGARGSNPQFAGGANGNCVSEKSAAGDPQGATACPGYPDALCSDYNKTASTGDAPPSELAVLAQSSAQTGIAQLRAATLLMQGESDTLFNENEAVATYLQLRARHVPVAMIWNYGGHGGYDSQPGECDVYGNGDSGLDRCYLPLRALAWFNRYLKHERVATGPGFAYFRDWVRYGGRGPDTSQYGTAPSYPAANYFRYELAASSGTGPADGSLLPAGLALPPGADSFARDPTMPPSYTETSNCTGPESGAPCPPGVRSLPPEDTSGEYVNFTSLPFTAPVVSVGVPIAHLYLSQTNGASDLIFFAKVWDVAPDGSATLIKRLIAPVRVPNQALGRPVNIELLGFAHLFPKGHAVRLTLAATDATSDVGAAMNVPDTITVSYGQPNPAPATTPDQQLAMYAPKDYSWFSLPMLSPRGAELYTEPGTVPGN